MKNKFNLTITNVNGIEQYNLSRDQLFFVLIKNCINGEIRAISNGSLLINNKNTTYSFSSNKEIMHLLLETCKVFPDYFTASDNINVFIDKVKTIYYLYGRRDIDKRKDRNITLNFLLSRPNNLSVDKLKTVKQIQHLFNYVTDSYMQ